MLTQAQIDSYHQDGYVQIPGMFNQAEIDLLYGVATDDSVVNNSFDLNDQNGKKTKLTLWFTAGDDSFGLMSRCARLVQGVQSLLGPGEVCHFHSKVMQKEPRVGGAWEWHQDYGYWYKNGFLYPEDMISVMVALTDATIEIGCLQVLKGTHKMQRIEHHFAGEQQGADMDFVQEAEKVSDLIFSPQCPPSLRSKSFGYCPLVCYFCLQLSPQYTFQGKKYLLHYTGSDGAR